VLPRTRIRAPAADAEQAAVLAAVQRSARRRNGSPQRARDAKLTPLRSVAMLS